MQVRIATWGVLLAAVVLLQVGACGAPLLDPDEARFARTSVEMLRSGDLVVPHFGGEPRLVKPPLVHWIQSFVFSWLGAGEWSARLHAALASLGSIALLGWIVRQRFGPEGGAWAGAILLTTPLFLIPGRLGTLDALLAVHVLAAVAFDLTDEGRRTPGRSLVLGGLLGLAFLVKGPVGVVLPLLIMLAGRTLAGRDVVPGVSTTLRALAAWCLVVLPWGMAFVRRVGWESALAVVRGEALERYFSGTTHVEPPWFYAKVLVVGCAPWFPVLLLAGLRLWRLRKHPAASTARYAAGGLVAGLLFFSVGRSKLPTYILPLLPLAALLVAWELGRELESPRERTGGPTLLALSSGALSIAFGAAAATTLQGDPRSVAWIAAFVYAAATVVCIVAAMRHRPRPAFAAVATATAVFLLAGVAWLLPHVGERRSSAGLVQAVPQLASRRPVSTVDMKVPSLTYYLDRHPEVVDMDRLDERVARDDDPLFVFDAVDLPAAPDAVMRQLRSIGAHGKYVVMEKRDRATSPPRPETPSSPRSGDP